MSPEHSPLIPWSIDDKCARWVLDAYGDHIATFWDKKHSVKNAADAVAAVNQHADLIAELAQVKAELAQVKAERDRLCAVARAARAVDDSWCRPENVPQQASPMQSLAEALAALSTATATNPQGA